LAAFVTPILLHFLAGSRSVMSGRRGIDDVKVRMLSA
jgi:hypothetical protein